jgi:phosphoribosyl 1,2-cyclic phosphodiesterase
VRVHVCGVRGSNPAPGPRFARYGGNTSCLAIAHDGDDLATLVLDAGTGLRNAAALHGDRPFAGTLLLTHLHWDHTHGLPFFAPGDRPDARAHLFLPEQPGGGAEELLARVMSPPHFPIRPSQLRGAWSFDALGEGKSRHEGFEVLAREIPHKGGRTFGFRVSDGSSSLAYLPDHCPTEFGAGPDGWGEYHDAARELADGVDLLVHDAHLLADELPEQAAFGHAAADYAAALGKACGARTTVLFHHHPERTDDELDALSARFRATGVETAVEGSVLTL